MCFCELQGTSSAYKRYLHSLLQTNSTAIIYLKTSLFANLPIHNFSLHRARSSFQNHLGVTIATVQVTVSTVCGSAVFSSIILHIPHPKPIVKGCCDKQHTWVCQFMSQRPTVQSLHRSLKFRLVVCKKK